MKYLTIIFLLACTMVFGQTREYPHNIEGYGWIQYKDTLKANFSVQDYYMLGRDGYRFGIQSQNSNTASRFELFTKDGDGTDNNTWNIIAVGTPDDMTNAEKLLVWYNAGLQEYCITSDTNGTGQLRPILIAADGSIDQLKVETDGNVSFADTIIAPVGKIDTIHFADNTIQTTAAIGTGNIYTNDGTLGSNRTMLGDTFSLTLGTGANRLNTFNVNAVEDMNINSRLNEDGDLWQTSITTDIYAGTWYLRGSLDGYGAGNIILGPDQLEFGSSAAGFGGATYANDYSSNYGDRSLVDKEYVISQSLYGANGTLAGNREVAGDFKSLKLGVVGDKVLAFEVNAAEDLILRTTDGPFNIFSPDFSVNLNGGSANILNGPFSVGVGSPPSSALVEFSSTTQGFLMPRMNSTQRDAIGIPAEGLFLYNTENDNPNFYNGSAWRRITHASAASLKEGGIVFSDDGLGGSLNNDSTNFYWDDVNNRLGIGNGAPTKSLDITGKLAVSDSAFLNQMVVGSTLNPIIITDTSSTAKILFNDKGKGDITLTPYTNADSKSAIYIDSFQVYTTGTDFSTQSGGYTVQDSNWTYMSWYDTPNFSDNFFKIDGKDGEAEMCVRFSAAGTRLGSEIFIPDNLAGNRTAPASDAFSFALSTNGGVINQNIKNSVIAGGTGVVADQDNTLFAQKIKFSSAVDETVIADAGSDGKITFFNTGAGDYDIVVGDPTFAKGYAEILSNLLLFSSKDGAGGMFLSIGEESAGPPDHCFQLGYNNGVAQNYFIQGLDNTGGDKTSVSGTDWLPVSLSSRTAIHRSGVTNSVAAGGVGVDINKDDFLFTQNLEVQGGDAQYSSYSAASFTDDDFAPVGYVDSAAAAIAGGAVVVRDSLQAGVTDSLLINTNALVVREDAFVGMGYNTQAFNERLRVNGNGVFAGNLALSGATGVGQAINLGTGDGIAIGGTNVLVGNSGITEICGQTHISLRDAVNLEIARFKRNESYVIAAPANGGAPLTDEKFSITSQYWDGAATQQKPFDFVNNVTGDDTAQFEMGFDGNAFLTISDTGSMNFDADYSANYTDRSVVDKAYVDNAVSSVSTTAGTVNTTNATVTLVDKIDDLTDNSTHFIKIFVSCEEDANTKGGTWVTSLRVKKRAGTVTLGTEQLDYFDAEAGLVAGSVTYVINSGDLDIMVQGIAATNFKWDSNYEIINVTTN